MSRPTLRRKDRSRYILESDPIYKYKYKAADLQAYKRKKLDFDELKMVVERSYQPLKHESRMKAKIEEAKRF